MIFDPLNTSRTKWGEILPDDQEAFLDLVGKGLQVQFWHISEGFWTDSIAFLASAWANYRICPRAFALHEISQLPGKGPAIRKARNIVRSAFTPAQPTPEK